VGKSAIGGQSALAGDFTTQWQFEMHPPAKHLLVSHHKYVLSTKPTVQLNEHTLFMRGVSTGQKWRHWQHGKIIGRRNGEAGAPGVRGGSVPAGLWPGRL
jgi:hypothetical protein